MKKQLAIAGRVAAAGAGLAATSYAAYAGITLRFAWHHPDSLGIAWAVDVRGRTTGSSSNVAMTTTEGTRANTRVETLRLLVRGVVAWLCIILVETIHGIARTIFLAPVIGDFRARQVAVFTGSILILGVAASCIRWVCPTKAADAISVGIVWLVLTVAFELAFGRYVVHATWARIASDYNLVRGGLLPIGLAVLVLAPFIAAKGRQLL